MQTKKNHDVSLKKKIKSSCKSVILPSYPGPRRSCLCCGRDLSSEFYVSTKNNQNMTVNICLSCFGSGTKIRNHFINLNRVYIMIPSYQNGFEDGWTMQEELEFIQAFAKTYSYDWVNISKIIRTKTPIQCKNHFFNSYILSRTAPDPRGGNIDKTELKMVKGKHKNTQKNPGNSKPNDESSIDFIAEQLISEVTFNENDSEEIFSKKLAMLESYDFAVQKSSSIDNALKKLSPAQNCLIEENESSFLKAAPEMILFDDPSTLERISKLIDDGEKILKENRVIQYMYGLHPVNDFQSILFQNMLDISNSKSIPTLPDWNFAMPIYDNFILQENFCKTLMTQNEIKFIEKHSITAKFYIDFKKCFFHHFNPATKTADELIFEKFPNDNTEAQIVWNYLSTEYLNLTS